MKTLKNLAVGACLALGLGGLGAVSASAQEAASLANSHLLSAGINLNATDSAGHWAHIMPTVDIAKRMAAALLPGPTLLLNHGGPIMPSIEIYNIFWVGALRGGGTATLTAHYETVADDFATDYAGHSIDSILTQYNQTSPSNTIHGLSTAGAGGSYAGSYIDTDAFPASGCTDSRTPKDCITDAQLRTEITKVMAAKGWTGGLNKIYLVYTGSGQGSCFDATSSSCAYTDYCAYHSSIGSGSTAVIYGNEPYAVPNACQGGTSPTGDPAADAAVSVASHETSEATTDPFGTTWWDSSGNEIGDKCAWNYGTNSYDSAKANQEWNLRYYELQMEFNNHTDSCTQAGPN